MNAVILKKKANCIANNVEFKIYLSHSRLKYVSQVYPFHLCAF